MFRFFLASLLLVTVVVSGASAQTKTRAARKKIAPYPARTTRKAANINPHTGKPYGAGVSQDVRDGSAYLAPGMPMRRQAGYQRNGGYNDNRTPRAAKPANRTLGRDSNVPVVPVKPK